MTIDCKISKRNSFWLVKSKCVDFDMLFNFHNLKKSHRKRKSKYDIKILIIIIV